MDEDLWLTIGVPIFALAIMSLAVLPTCLIIIICACLVIRQNSIQNQRVRRQIPVRIITPISLLNERCHVNYTGMIIVLAQYHTNNWFITVNMSLFMYKFTCIQGVSSLHLVTPLTCA